MVVNEKAPRTLPPAPTVKPLLTFKADDARYAGFPNYIFGLHDRGGESNMFAANKPGWVVVSVQVNPPDSSGDFSALADKGLGLLVRLNNSYGSAGTIPNPMQYDQFAMQCAAFVGKSKGARIWIIGNETNTAIERPGNDGSTNSGELITPTSYARGFNRVRQVIRAIPGHENDWVIPAAVGPFNTQTTYPGNPSGDWVRYFADTLFQITIQGGAVDGLALHTYTHGYDANLVTSEQMASGNFTNRHWQFRGYRDFLAAVLPAMRNLPVFLTEAQPVEPGWTNQNRNWIQAACAEINAWNANRANQPIQALCFFRWQSLPGDRPGWGMSDKPLVVNDFRLALQNDYRVRWPGVQPTPDYRAQWASVINVPMNTMTTGQVIMGRVVVKNTGAKAWLSSGANPVRVGYHWYNQQGIEIPVLPNPGHFNLPQNILPGQTASIDNIRLRAPQWQGGYTLKFDLVQEGVTWFSALASPTKDVSVTVNAPPYAVEWDQVVNVPNNAMATNANIIGTVTVKNQGSRTWFKTGANPVKLGFHWYNAQGVETPVTPYAGDFEMEADTPPGKTAAFKGVILRSPQWEGTFTLRWDLVQEGITWFSAQGAVTQDQVVTVTIPLPDYAAKWVSVFVEVPPAIRGIKDVSESRHAEIPESVEPNETISGSLTVQNVGAQIWNSSGDNPVRLGYHWYDPDGNEVLIAPYAGNFSLKEDVPPQASVTFDDVVVRAPIPRGKYTLAFDLLKENVTWFSATGSRPFDAAVTVKTDSPDYFAEWQETVTIPDNTMTAEESVTGRVALKNAGALGWDVEGTNPVRLGYRWFDSAGQVAPLPDGVATVSLPHAVPPRESISFDDLAVVAPGTAGDYTLKWDLQRAGLDWLSVDGSPTSDLAVHVKPPPLPWGAEFISNNTPASLVIGQTTNVDLQIRNVGKNIWKSDGSNPVHAAYKWFNASGQQQLDVEDHRTALPGNISPDANVDFAALLAAPRTPGTYRLHWDLIAEGAAWFAEGGNPALILPVNVTPTPAPTNLWRAEASHNAASGILAIDGDLGSFWSSQANQMPGMWFRVNLGTPQLIDGIAFRSPGDGYPFGYTLRISSDGQIWRTVWGVAQGNTRDIVATFAPYAVLYAQVDLLVPSEGEWMIAEVQIHPTPPWHATASVNNELAANAIDDNPSTAWTTTMDAPQTPNTWFQLDLGQVESISGLRLVPPKDEIPLGYRVSAWNQQASGWQKISERSNNTETINIAFAPIQTQYINIQLLQASDQLWAIREARVTKAMTNWLGPNS